MHKLDCYNYFESINESYAHFEKIGTISLFEKGCI